MCHGGGAFRGLEADVDGLDTEQPVVESDADDVNHRLPAVPRVPHIGGSSYIVLEHCF